MHCFDELRAVATEQNLLGEFPDWLLKEVLLIVDQPEDYKEVLSQVEILTSQIREYDPFAGSGCFNTSVSADTIQTFIRKIKSCQTEALTPGQSNESGGS